jgi:hypothetical protein
MTSKEFIIWLRGFSEGVHEFNITPKQWDILKEKLADVSDDVIPTGGLLTDPNPLRTVYPNWTGINPYEIRGPETFTSTRITTTPGITGHITVANPYIASFGTVTTSTATNLPSGSTISYTTSNDKTLLND